MSIEIEIVLYFYKNFIFNFFFLNCRTKQKDILIEKLAEDLKQKDVTVEKLNTELNGCKSEITRLSSELTKYKTDLPKLREELEAQRNKNNVSKKRKIV